MKVRNKLYGGEVELMFDSFRHQYTLNNKVVPSVTKILGIVNKPALVAWAANSAIDYVSKQIEAGELYDEIQLESIWDAGRKNHYQKKTDAGTIGSFVHNWVEDYIKGKKPAMPVNVDLQEAIKKFLGWKIDNEVEFLTSEQVCYSKKYNYTGTLDFICKIDGKLYLGDLKTSKGIYPEYLMQTAAYRKAREEEYPDEDYSGQMILRIGKEGGFEFAVIRDQAVYKEMLVGFIAALKLHEQMEFLRNYSWEQL